MKLRKITVGSFLVSSFFVGTAAADQDLSIDELPPAVRATVEREVGDGVIEEIEWENGRKGTYYEIEFYRAGQEWELHVAENGAVIRKYLD